MGVNLSQKGYGVFDNTMLRPLLFTPWNHTRPFYFADALLGILSFFK